MATPCGGASVSGTSGTGISATLPAVTNTLAAKRAAMSSDVPDEDIVCLLPASTSAAGEQPLYIYL